MPNAEHNNTDTIINELCKEARPALEYVYDLGVLIRANRHDPAAVRDGWHMLVSLRNAAAEMPYSDGRAELLDRINSEMDRARDALAEGDDATARIAATGGSAS